MAAYHATFEARQRQREGFVLSVDTGNKCRRVGQQFVLRPQSRGDGLRGRSLWGMHMLYSILIYGDEGHVAAWTAQEEKEVMGRHAELRRQLTAAGQLGPVMRLNPEGTKIVRRYKDRRSITDGPYAETKEQLMGIYVVDCPSIEEAIAA